MSQNNVTIGRNCVVHPTARLLAKELVIGDFTKIGPNVTIDGDCVEIGREAWIANGVLIGGGRSEMGFLKTGDFLHLGKDSMVNTANEVIIGNEVGIGMNSNIFAHGAYLSQYDGFPYQDAPVRIGSNVWIPYAIVSPGVTLGDEIVIAAMSLVNRDLPSGCLAGGIPVSILRENVYPREVSEEEKKVVLDQIVSEAQRYSLFVERNSAGTTLTLGKTVFDIPARKIEGPANEETERVKDLLRRHGIRFKFYHDGESYRVWD